MILYSLVGLAGRFVTTAYNPAPLVDLRKTVPFSLACDGVDLSLGAKVLVRRLDDPAYGSGLRLTGDDLAKGECSACLGVALPLVEGLAPFVELLLGR